MRSEHDDSNCEMFRIAYRTFIERYFAPFLDVFKKKNYETSTGIRSMFARERTLLKLCVKIFHEAKVYSTFVSFVTNNGNIFPLFDNFFFFFKTLGETCPIFTKNLSYFYKRNDTTMKLKSPYTISTSI